MSPKTDWLRISSFFFYDFFGPAAAALRPKRDMRRCLGVLASRVLVDLRLPEVEKNEKFKLFSMMV